MNLREMLERFHRGAGRDYLVTVVIGMTAVVIVDRSIAGSQTPASSEPHPAS